MRRWLRLSRLGGAFGSGRSVIYIGGRSRSSRLLRCFSALADLAARMAHTGRRYTAARCTITGRCIACIAWLAGGWRLTGRKFRRGRFGARSAALWRGRLIAARSTHITITGLCGACGATRLRQRRILRDGAGKRWLLVGSGAYGAAALWGGRFGHFGCPAGVVGCLGRRLMCCGGILTPSAAAGRGKGFLIFWHTGLLSGRAKSHCVTGGIAPTHAVTAPNVGQDKLNNGSYHTRHQRHMHGFMGFMGFMRRATRRRAQNMRRESAIRFQSAKRHVARFHETFRRFPMLSPHPASLRGGGDNRDDIHGSDGRDNASSVLALRRSRRASGLRSVLDTLITLTPL